MNSQTSGTGSGRSAGRNGPLNCPDCGVRAEPGQSFCDSCGAVLGWTAEQPVNAEPPEIAQTTQAAQTAGGVGTRVGAEAAGTATTGPAPSGQDQADMGTPPSGADGADGADAPVPSTPPAPPTPPTNPDDTVARARSLLVPVEDPDSPQSPPPSVTPVLPGRPDADHPQVRAPARESDERGGVPCPWCATPNRPDRHFCGSCAMPMSRHEDAAPPVGPRPWWRRLLNSRNEETPWAGDRPRLRRGFGRIFNWIVGAVVLGLLAVAALNANTAYHAVRDHFAKRAPAAPNSVKASRSFPGHKPQLAFDKLNNTWWGPGVNQSGAGEWVEARFEQPTRLLDVIITPGISARADQLSKSALPHRVEATITKPDGKKETHFLTLDQGAGGQLRPFKVGSVSAVRFTVRSSYAASDDKQLSIAEIEFFGPSNGGS
ncbi:NADase-type glycan-binding domain-containing protein [Streptomyces sp. NPDC002851]